MSGIKDQDNIEELRKRLYERDFSQGPNHLSDVKLTKPTVDVSRGWSNPQPVNDGIVAQTPIDDEPAVVKVAEVVAEKMTEEETKKPRPWRLIMLLGSLLVFIVVAAISSIYLFFGANQISGKNISLDVAAPNSVAAGEKVTLQVNIANQNSVPIESATLIINYPSGTKTADESAKDLFEIRLPVEVISTGEARTVPVAAVLFGEENEEKEIKVSIEYRVQGSNSTFFKEAEAKKVKINSSPLVIRVDSVDKVSSGQEVELKLTVQSNAPTVQKNILIKASYPNTFTFGSSEPAPAYGQNEWFIKELLPESSVVITLKGQVKGVAGENAEIQFEAGAPRSDNQFMMGSVLTKAKTSYLIESAFLDVSVEVNGKKGSTVVLESGETASVIVRVKNTLEESVYDMRAEVVPKGNLIRDSLMSVDKGFYDQATKQINYESSGQSDLSEVGPGEEITLRFDVKADKKQTTAAFDVSTKVYARRVREASAAEELVGSAVGSVKYSSALVLNNEISRNTGPFTESGPVPPVAGEETTYTLTFEVAGGVNDVTGGTFTANLPQHVNWKDVYKGEGNIVFNPVAKQFRWEVGTLDAGQVKRLQVQVGLLPSVTQVGTTPTVVGAQEFRATDRFTGVTLTATGRSLSTELSEEAGFEDGNGLVTD